MMESTTDMSIPQIALNSKFVALSDGNSLVYFDPSNPNQTSSVAVTGVEGVLLGIDFDTLGGFDIISSPDSENAAFAVSNSTLNLIEFLKLECVL